MMTTAIFVTPGRSPKRTPSCDYQAAAIFDGGRDAMFSYSGMSREDCIRWLELGAWGNLAYRPENDQRFTIAQEYTGHPVDPLRWVVRFCGNWINLTSTDYEEAAQMRDDYAIGRRWATLLPDLSLTPPTTGDSP